MATQGGLQWDNDNDMTINNILFSRYTDNRYTMGLQSALVYRIVMFYIICMETIIEAEATLEII